MNALGDLIDPLRVDLASPDYYGLDAGEKLAFDSRVYQPYTRLIYHGRGLFQVQIQPWVNGTFNARGSFSFFQGERVLLRPGFGVTFAPLTINGRYEEWVPPGRSLFPTARYSFATGSALYNHYAGDEVELTVHAMSSYRDGDGGTWPGVTDEPGKVFTAEVVGPAGVAPLSFRPMRREGWLRWQFQLRWTLTVPGNYSVLVRYGGEPIQGDSSTEQTSMPASPWHVRVLPAPVDPFATRAEGRGLSAARAGELATFTVRTVDIFGLPALPEEHSTFRGDELVNATLLGVTGPQLVVDVVSQADGTYAGAYTATQTGDYSLFLMVNGVAAAGSPRVVRVEPALPSPALSTWELRSMGPGGRLCQRNGVGLDTCAANAPRDAALDGAVVSAGTAHSAVVTLRDGANNTAAPVLRVGREGVAMRLEGPAGAAELSPAPESEGPQVLAHFAVTLAGAYRLSVSLFGAPLAGPPLRFAVAAARVHVPNCFLDGAGLARTRVGRAARLALHGRDLFGNVAALSAADVRFEVTAPPDGAPAEVTVLPGESGGARVALEFTMHAVGAHTLAVTAAGADGAQARVPGSGARVEAFRARPPRVARVALLPAGTGFSLTFDAPSDTGCMNGVLHPRCVVAPPEPSEDCCLLFDAPTCAVLGAAGAAGAARALCMWRDAVQVDVTLGSGATIPLWGEMRFRGTVRDASGESEPVRGSVVLPAPDPPLHPDTRPAYQQAISRCDTWVIDLGGATGGGGRPLRFVWEPLSPGLAPLAPRLAAVPPGQTRLALRGSELALGSNQLRVTASNWLGLANASVVAVTVDGAPRLLGRVVQGTRVETARPRAVELSGEVEGSDCFSVASLTVGWRWRAGAGVTPGAAVSDTASVRLPGGSLAAGGEYELEFFAATQDASTGAPLTLAIPVVVAVRSSPLLAQIAGPNGEVSANATLVFDASASSDPDEAPAPMAFEWRCRPVLELGASLSSPAAATSAEPCFFDTAGALRTPGPVLDLTGLLGAGNFACAACLPGAFELSVLVSKGAAEDPGRREATAHSIVLARLGAPSVLAGIVPLRDAEVSPSALTKLDAILVPPPPGGDAAAAGLSFQWSLANSATGCASPPSLPKPGGPRLRRTRRIAR